eukprot:739527-Pyramimonas_sp.AAC.1
MEQVQRRCRPGCLAPPAAGGSLHSSCLSSLFSAHLLLIYDSNCPRARDTECCPGCVCSPPQ